MHRFRLLWLTLSLLLFAPTLWAQPYFPQQLIVHLAPGSSLEQLLRRPLLNETGKKVMLRREKTLSVRMGFYLLSWQAKGLSVAQARDQLSGRPGILAVQPNHRVQLRATPDDPLFPQQWALQNTGQDTGTPGVDIRATTAWDLSQGGLSSLGDTLVLAIVDDGADLAHEDLWFWKNRDEIPGNGLDDDQNGYVDDYDGWNSQQSNGQVPVESHGTQVTSIAAARTDNNLGMAGVAWQTQVMPVRGAVGGEAEVVEAYVYVLEQRRRYDASFGTEGAFVIATNSSFGIDGALPEDFPIWCSLYDSLGAAGILNVASTTNLNRDVELVGDMPTRCLSDWLVTVTSTDANDSRSAAGYGATSIDLGAPGQGLVVALPGDNYGFNSGTSFAAPHVAGALALLYGAACPALIAQYKTDPAGTALLFKQWLLDGADTLASLAGFTRTGARLNVLRSLELMQTYCDSLPQGCLPPYQLSLDLLLDTTATLSWVAIDSANGYEVRYRPQGNPLWTTLSQVADTTFSFPNLARCTRYEVQLRSLCSGGPGYSPSFTFRTEGCCEIPANLSLDSLGTSQAFFSWDSVFGVLDYYTEIRPQGAAAADTLVVADTLLLLDSLQACTTYELRLGSRCDTAPNQLSAPLVFRTKGCGACLDQDYCASTGQDVVLEWIDRVQFGPVDQQSGADGGYGDYRFSGYQVVRDSVYELKLAPGFAGTAFQEAWRVWIDWNQDGVFQLPAEEVAASGATNQPVTLTVRVPDTAALGLTRMRVSMEYAGFSGNQFPSPCETFESGEVEDYCLTISTGDSIFCPTPSNLQGSYAFGLEQIQLDWDPVAQAMDYEVRLLATETNSLAFLPADSSFRVIGSLSACTDYELAVRAQCGDFFSAFTSPVAVRVPGCGTCLDSSYCENNGLSDDLWLAAASLAGQRVISGNDGGYDDFTGLSVAMQIGETINFWLVPGRSGSFSAPVDGAIFIDWDQDGTFDQPGERGAFFDGSLADTLRASVTVPASAQLGSTRLRLVVGETALACGPMGAGEVEDYCAEIMPLVSRASPVDWALRIYPNPAQDQLRVESERPLLRWQLVDVTGREWLAGAGRGTALQLSVAALPTGMYLLRLEAAAGVVVKKVWVE